MRGPSEPRFTEDQRRAAGEVLARVEAGELDAPELAALVRQARATGRESEPGTPPEGEVRVWSVLTVDVVGGRVQAVRIVRNPDKLRHL